MVYCFVMITVWTTMVETDGKVYMVRVVFTTFYNHAGDRCLSLEDITINPSISGVEFQRERRDKHRLIGTNRWKHLETVLSHIQTTSLWKLINHDRLATCWRFSTMSKWLSRSWHTTSNPHAESNPTNIHPRCFSCSPASLLEDWISLISSAESWLKLQRSSTHLI